MWGVGMGRRDGTPLWVEDTKTEVLHRADLGASGEGGAYDEAWLQRLLYENPTIPPIEQIEPGFGKLVSLCRELMLTFGNGRTGNLDNLFVTPQGRLVLVE